MVYGGVGMVKQLILRIMRGNCLCKTLKQSRCLDKTGHNYRKYYIYVTGVMIY